MKIAYSLYELEAPAPLLKRKGAILKFEGDKMAAGYADCHPWPELGDLPLKEQLSALSQGNFTSLTRQALEFALIDAKSRSSKTQALNQRPIPSSHFLIIDMFSLTERQICRIIEMGFTHVKLKAGRSIDEQADCLLALFSACSLKLRLDFNEKLTLDAFRSFLKKMEKLHDRIDFIEDPFPYDKEQWSSVQKEGWPLACDRQMKNALNCPESAGILIVKPALQSIKKLGIERPAGQSLIVTSYVGHPVEQTAAAFAASQLDPSGAFIHGLLSHHAYLPNLFSRKLNWESPSFIPPPGFGLGFEEEFHELQWRSLP